MMQSTATPPSVLVAHNRYQQPGGEDVVVGAEVALLEAHGHAVLRYELHNDAIDRMGRVRLAAATVWNRETYRRVRALHAQSPFEVAHLHNTFPLMSPAAYRGARDAGAAVVQTLHNFRLLCPNALFLRDGRACEDCLGRAVAWPAVLHACYRGSRAASAVTAGMVAVHRAAGTWQRDVNLYCALSEFARRKFVEGGLPPERVVVEPNFLADDPGPGQHEGGFLLYVGRLSDEKGVRTLLEAAAGLAAAGRPVPLVVVGAGPLAPLFETPPAGVSWRGALPHGEVLALMQRAAALVVPSTCYENCPMSVIEAFATGLPVIASGHGGLLEMVDADSGRHVRPGDAAALGRLLDWVHRQPEQLRPLGEGARRAYERRYTAERHYQRLRAIYDEALKRRRTIDGGQPCAAYAEGTGA